MTQGGQGGETERKIHCSCTTHRTRSKNKSRVSSSSRRRRRSSSSDSLHPSLVECALCTLSLTSVSRHACLRGCSFRTFWPFHWLISVPVSICPSGITGTCGSKLPRFQCHQCSGKHVKRSGRRYGSSHELSFRQPSRPAVWIAARQLGGGWYRKHSRRHGSRQERATHPASATPATSGATPLSGIASVTPGIRSHLHSPPSTGRPVPRRAHRCLW